MGSSKNKLHRQAAWIEEKKTKSRAKHEARHARRREEEQNPELRARRLAKNKPITLEDKRVWPQEEQKQEPKAEDRERHEAQGSDDDSWFGEDSDIEEDEDEDHSGHDRTPRKPDKSAQPKPVPDLPDKFANLLQDPPLPEPKILITTSRHSTLHKQAETLVDVIPNSTYIPRSGHRFSYEYSVPEICKFASNRGYSAVLFLLEDQKRPYGLDVAMLPAGPMLHFSIKTWVDGKILPNHGRSTGHIPELLLNNFITPLGRLVGRAFQRLFPNRPELVGRQVLSISNMRDWIFIRRHRYAMRDKRPTEQSVVGADGRPMKAVEDVKVALQEIGPRITLKLRRVDKGIARKSGQEFEWTGRMDKVRTNFQL